MSDPVRILGFSGSLRAGSLNAALLRAAGELLPEGAVLEWADWRELPVYDQDLESGGQAPPSVVRLREQVAAAHAVLFATPEYNYSVPGGLKNAIDWASRPWGQNSFTGKPSAVIGCSIGAIGTALAQSHLRGVLSFCNAPQMSSPEAYIQFSQGLIADDFSVTVESTREFLRKYMDEFASFIARVYTVLPRNT